MARRPGGKPRPGGNEGPVLLLEAIRWDLDEEAEPTAAFEPAEAAGSDGVETGAASDEWNGRVGVSQTEAFLVGQAEATAVNEAVVDDGWTAVCAAKAAARGAASTAEDEAAGAADAVCGDEAVLSGDVVLAAGVKAAGEEAMCEGGKSAAAA